MNRTSEKYFTKLLLFFLTANLFAAEFSLSVGPRYSFRNSTTEEILYFSGTFNTDKNKVCSLLEWNEKAVMSAGIGTQGQLTTDSGNSFIFSADFDFTFPYNSSWMSDSDWSSSGVKFNYSKFDCTLDSPFSGGGIKNFSAETYFAYKVMLPWSAEIQPRFGFRYSSVHYKARNGYGWYGSSRWTSDGKLHPWNSPWSHYFPDGKYHLAGINYYVRKTAVFTGLELSKKLKSSFSVFAGADLYPFTFVLAADRHLGSRDYYETCDYVYNICRSYDFYGGIKTELSSRITLNMNLTYYVFEISRGKQFYEFDEGGTEKSGQDGGFSNRTWCFTSSLSYRF